MLTQGLEREETRRRRVGGKVLLRRWGGARGPGAVVVLRVPGLLDSVRGQVAEANRESGRAKEFQ